MAVAPMAGALSARFGPKWVVTGGMLCESTAIFWIGRLTTADMPFLALLPPLVLYGAGVGLAIAQLTNITLSDIPRQSAGAGSGANNTVRQIGAAIGIAILGATLTARMSAIGKAELAASSAVPAFVKPAIAQVFDQGLSEGPQSAPAGFANTPASKAIQRIFADAITGGTRSAATVASCSC